MLQLAKSREGGKVQANLDQAKCKGGRKAQATIGPICTLANLWGQASTHGRVFQIWGLKYPTKTKRAMVFKLWGQKY